MNFLKSEFNSEGNTPAETFYPKGPWLVKFDEIIKCKTRFGKTFERDPKKIMAIKIITNDRGPFREDVFWKFEHEDGDFYFPSSSDITGSFTSMMQGLKGFNNEELIKAMSSAENAIFVVWDRNAL